VTPSSGSSEYERAYSDLDEAGLKRLQPSFDGIPSHVRTLARSVSLTISVASVEISDDGRNATVSLTQTFRYEWRRAGLPPEQSAATRWRLTKSGQRWRIEDIAR
jgi:hypothetical protein